MKKIFITGGHFAPAKAVISKLSGWEIYYLGRKYAMEDEKALALEYEEITGVHYLVITTGRLQRKFFVNVGQSIKALLKIPVGFIQAFYYVLRYQPHVVLSFGGYVAIPVVVAAWLLDTPVVTHEQTTVPGLANKLISLFANKTLVSWGPNAVGNPLREEILQAKSTTSSLIYITGGNQGSHSLNLVIEKILSKLKMPVVHQMGDSSYHDYDRVKESKKYKSFKFLGGEESAKIMARSKLVISRAGANTISEIAYFGKPAIIVPLPWSGGGEQLKNAQMLASFGGAEIIEQKDLTPKHLLETIDKILSNYKVYLENAKKAKSLIHPDAAEKIIKEVEYLAS